MAGYLKLDGREFQVDVAIMSYREEVNILDGKNSGRVQYEGEMHRDIIGAFPQYTIVARAKGPDHTGLDELWNFLWDNHMEEFIYCEFADGQTSITGDFYYSKFGRDLLRVENDERHWGEIELVFTARKAMKK